MQAEGFEPRTQLLAVDLKSAPLTTRANLLRGREPSRLQRKRASRREPCRVGGRAFEDEQEQGLFWELSPGPLAPEARIMPLDQTAVYFDLLRLQVMLKKAAVIVRAFVRLFS